MKAKITGLGVWVPDNVVTNKDLESLVQTSDEWIVTRTGIRERRIVPKELHYKASDIGSFAALKALEAANLKADELDGIIVASINPDKQFPATACFVQAKIGASQAFAFDVTAACAGFVVALNQAALLVAAGQAKNILVIGAELLSPVIDWSDRNTCILFGDAAGAVIVGESNNAGQGVLQSGILRSMLKSDGNASEILYLNSQLSFNEKQIDPENNLKPNCMNMDGKQVFKMAVKELSDIVSRCLSAEGLKPSDLDLLVPHQANSRIIQAVGERLGLKENQVIINVQKYGNTSSASIPLALNDALLEGRLKPGMLVALAAIGGGMTWGCNLIRW